MTLYQDIMATVEAYNEGLSHGLAASGFEGATLTECAVLALVIEAPKSIVQIALERGVTKQAVQSQVQSLSARGLAEIAIDASDKRVRLISPSKKGRQLVATLSDVQSGLDAAIEDKLGTERLKNFRNMLGQVTGAVS